MPPKDDAKEKITMMMHPGLRDRLREMAAEANVPYQTLAHSILADEVAGQIGYSKAAPLHRLAYITHELGQLTEKAFAELGKLSDSEKKDIEVAFQHLQKSTALFNSIFISDDEDD